MDIETIKASVRNVSDFPQPGVIFRDLTPTFCRADCLQWMLDHLYERYKNAGITKVIGIESRGFIMAPALAVQLHAGFVLLRKKGKLPAETLEETYEKEYGWDTIQIHKDALCANDVVLLHDDLLATGGTMRAAYRLVKQFGVKKIYINFLVELDDLNGRSLFDQEAEIDAMIHF